MFRWPVFRGYPSDAYYGAMFSRNALAPSVQVFALSMQYLLGGVIVTETVFNYPGVGRQLVNAVSSHDDTEVQAIALILAAIYISINVVADLLVMVLVPKLRTES